MNPVWNIIKHNVVGSEAARIGRVNMPWEGNLRWGTLPEMPKSVRASRRAWQDVHDLMERLVNHITQRERL